MSQADMPALYHHTPAGWLALRADERGLRSVQFAEGPGPAPEAPCPTLQQAAAELDEYFAGQRRVFTVPLSLDGQGTPFQRRVWQALQRIPYGSTCTYAELAAAVGCPRGYRAVGMANHNNPLPVFIPCHRVINTGGGLGGYAGGLDVKRRLLALEGAL